MWVRFLDKSLKGFLKLSLAILGLFLIAIFLFAFFYQYSTLNTYNYILLFLTIVTIIIMVLVVFSVFAIIVSYKSKKTNKIYLLLIKLGLKLLMPSILYISGVSKVNKDSIRQLYIGMNNLLVQHQADRKFSPDEVLLILPHCLQNSKCIYKVTGAISNCKRCGQCCIGEIAAVSDEIGVTAEIVTGGTAARNIVSNKKPGIILSVACERDLTSGISEVAGIPVVGIINERPNGPCCNTNVDAKVIESQLKRIINDG
jgi:uncharacterized protein